MSQTLDLASTLISKPSITPADADCQLIMDKHLKKLGFSIEYIHSGGVKNFWARRGNQQPLFVFAGHTDVVPTGPAEQWDNPPFEPTIKNGMLYGRGSADMKGSLASMLIACESFIRQHPNHQGSIGFLITSDEEGPATDGTIKVVEKLEQRSEKIDYCLVGEPSSNSTLGDMIKNGRRGSLSGVLNIIGKQGHVAYPNLASNPIHLAAPLINDLIQYEWDHGNQYFPTTTFQISNIQAGTGAENVIPGEMNLCFNLRYSTEIDHHTIINTIESLINKHQLDYTVSWRHSGQPFLTPEAELVQAAKSAIRKILNIETELSTSGGTSDGRFIAPTGAQVLELGPVNKTIHQINECVSVQQLEMLTLVYEEILNQLLT